MKLINTLHKFIHHEAAGGFILVFFTVLAMLIANSSLNHTYFSGLTAYIGPLSVLHWINDGLMAIFFLVVGLELKRELISGELSQTSQRILPGVAALGGAIIPAFIYVLINTQDTGELNGWAIPAATDIAFALGILSILGSRVPIALKIFLTALAIIDDIAAILIIAVFYTSQLNLMALLAVVALSILLILLNIKGIKHLAAYLIIGAFLWAFMLQSGIHATISGVILALLIPHDRTDATQSPLLRLEHRLHPWVAFLIVPLFAFANAGISFDGVSINTLQHPVTLGIICGLFFGKPIGVFLFSYWVIQCKWAKMPDGVSFRQLFGVSILCGIGFTMSIFIGLLAFPEDPFLLNATKIGVILGSLLSALCAIVILSYRKKPVLN